MKKGFFLIIVLAYSGLIFAQEITSVNFVQEGEVSKLIIETDKDDIFAERFHVTEDKQIILDLKNVTVSPKHLRGIDTSEFPGSAVFISGYKKPGTTKDVRFAVQLRDNVRSILENKGKSIVLSIENRFGVFSQSKIRNSENVSLPGSEKLEDVVGLNVPKSNSIDDILTNLTLAGPKKYIGKRISINVKEIPISDLLNMIADTSGFNIIIDKEVLAAPALTLTLTNIPWDQALDTVLNLSKLVAQKSANILVVKTKETAAKELQNEIALQKAKQEVEPMVTKVFPINYADITQIRTILTDYLTQKESASGPPTILGRIQVDDRTNSLIIKDSVEAMERIKKIIETLDTQTPQIMIEAKVVEASESYSKRIGLTRGVTFGYDPIRTGIGDLPTGPGFSFSSAPTPSAPSIAGMTVGIYKRILNLDASLQLMEAESKGRIISTPRILTQNKKSATITSTETTSFAQSTIVAGVTQTTFSNLNAPVTLNVTPQVTNDGAIAMSLTISKTSFGARPSPQAPPNSTQRSINTNVLVDNGSTVVIGGLYTTSHLEAVSGIPLLKDLPLIGWLFRSPYNPDTTKNELVVFLTPRIINQEEAGFTDRQTAKAGQTKDL